MIEASSALPPVRVPLARALGRILAEPVAADRDIPPFPRAMMDGFAVRLASAGRTVAVAGEVAAGEEGRTPVAADACIEVLTGAPAAAGIPGIAGASGPSAAFGTWEIRPIPTASSADVFASVTANAYVEVPPGVEELAPGTAARFAWMRGAESDVASTAGDTAGSTAEGTAASSAGRASGTADGGGPTRAVTGGTKGAARGGAP